MNKEQILHLANLAKIEITEGELEEINSQIGNIVNFVSRMQEIDTTNVDIMYTPIEGVNLNYKVVTNTQVNSEDLLKNSPHEVENNMIVIKSSTVEH